MDIAVPRPSPSLEDHLQSHGLEEKDDGLIGWVNGTSHHPRNWTTVRKCYDVSIVIFLEFFTGAIGTAGIAVSEQASRDYSIDNTLSIFLFTSTYLFGQGLGGIVLTPYSESFGRKNLYIATTAMYAAFCVVMGAVNSLPAAVIGRFMTGILSSVPTSVAAGSIEDLFDTEARVWVFFIWITLANLGLFLGAILGVYLSVTIGWRWIFYIAAAVTGAVALLFLTARESRPSQLLIRRVQIIQKATGQTSLRARNPDQSPSFAVFIRTSLFRPIYLLVTEPIVFIVSIMTAVAFGIIYLFIEAFQVVYSFYGFSVQSTSLAFIPVSIGLLLSIFVRLYDSALITRRKRLKQKLEPESMLTGFVVAAPFLALSLWWFAWTVPPQVQAPWIVSMIALVPVGFAANEFDCVLAGYMTNSYTTYSASAFAALSILRSTFSATFPLFSHQMYVNLGANYATTILAGIATISCVSPFVLLKYGSSIRERSKFARYSSQVYEENRADLVHDDLISMG